MNGAAVSVFIGNGFRVVAGDAPNMPRMCREQYTSVDAARARFRDFPRILSALDLIEAPAVRKPAVRRKGIIATAGASIALAALALAGCSTLRQPEEMAWQALHAVDFAQTMKIPGDPCLKENDPLTSALIGKHPTKKGVIAWGVASAGAHLLVSDLLRERNMDGAYALWQAVTITGAAYTVGNNHAIGIRIGKRNTAKARCES